jgi:hypothetical protein
MKVSFVLSLCTPEKKLTTARVPGINLFIKIILYPYLLNQPSAFSSDSFFMNLSLPGTNYFFTEKFSDIKYIATKPIVLRQLY